MTSSAGNPTQHIFERPLAPHQDWLGRIVSSCQDPSASSLTTLASLASDVLISIKSEFLLQISATRDSGLSSRLSRLLDTSSAEVDVPIPDIVLRRLEDPKKILDELISRPETMKELLDTLPLRSELYIVVGVVEIDSVSIDRLKKTRRTSGGISLPVTDVASAAAGLAVTLDDVGDIELIPMATNSSYSWNSGVSEGRETIAMEFRAVRKFPNESQGPESTELLEGSGVIEILDEVFLGCVAGPSIGWDPYTKIKYHFSDKDTE